MLIDQVSSGFFLVQRYSVWVKHSGFFLARCSINLANYSFLTNHTNGNQIDFHTNSLSPQMVTKQTVDFSSHTFTGSYACREMPKADDRNKTQY